MGWPEAVAIVGMWIGCGIIGFRDAAHGTGATFFAMIASIGVANF